jgi:Ca2+-binding RTX toxin-like protein
MQIILNGWDNAFFETSLSDGQDGIANHTPTTTTATQYTIVNDVNGAILNLTGTGFTYSDGEITGGTITGLSVVHSNMLQGSFSGISWFVGDLDAAITAYEENDDLAPMAALFNASGAIEIDASGASGSARVPEMFGDLLPLLNGPIDFTGSQFGDQYAGSAAADTVDMGTNPFDTDYFAAGPGNDTISFEDATSTGYFVLDYIGIGQAVTVTLDGNANTGSVASAQFTDTLLLPRNAMLADGLQVRGTNSGDIFNVNTGPNGWADLVGGIGNDTYNLTLDGAVRVTFAGNTNTGATQGLVANLATGVISNDGFGGNDQINVLGGISRLEINGTSHVDQITGSARSESFILGEGTGDSVDGGGGNDRLRYDRNGVSDLEVDMAAGTATGNWHGQSFSHGFTSIEQIRGTRDGADTLLGSAGADMIEGRGGDDIISGRAGNDRLYGEDGNDSLTGGDGDDLLVGGTGNDSLAGGDGTDTLNGGDGDDTLMGGETAADLRDVIYGGEGQDLIDGGYGNDELRGDGGNDTITGGAGVDTIIGGNGDDVLTGQTWSDVILGGDGMDFINGGFGHDRLNGGADADRFFHIGNLGHGSDWIQDFSNAEGDVLQYGAAASVDDFLVIFDETANAGAAGVEEAFVVYRPTQQILWALVDGAAQDEINIVLGGQEYDLLA